MSPPPAGPTRIILDLKGGVDDWKESFKQFLLTIKGSDGVVHHQWGPWEEDRSKLELIAVWVPKDKIQEFGASPHHQKCVETLKPVLKSMPTKCPRLDIDVSKAGPPPLPMFKTPVLEVITIDHCTGDAEAMKATLANAQKLSGCTLTHCGIMQTDTPDRGTIWIAWVGWESVEHSNKADKALYTPKGVGEVEVHHVNMNFPIKGFSATNPEHKVPPMLMKEA
ncbi:hypothetical protein XA68_13321 [Ophiocordyceps unilateralis]|uniref:ABM domain-containing protein n=1 Tax=Ophiocordyceps unilateralis TaxID=268505 RepID=A0A2A9PB05_OPHUN|nr:hypothetical protein XA68_13321 [Ophiocordyceps unilateralis]